MLVEFTKDGRPELKILDPLYVYGDDGNYTEEIRKIFYVHSILIYRSLNNYFIITNFYYKLSIIKYLKRKIVF